MATVIRGLLPAPQPVTTGTVQVRVLLTPVRGQDGQLRWLEQTVPGNQPLAAVLPVGGTWERVIVNGRVIPPEEYPRLSVQDGDEVLCIPAWGFPALIPMLIALVVSIAIQYLVSYVLFPPTKPTMTSPFESDEQTFGWTGIKTSQGPGAMVPVIYGRHRVGGQLLSASIQQAITEVHDGPQVTVNWVTAEAQTPTLTMLLALGEGPVAAINTNTIELNGQPLSNFTGVELFTRLGTADQTPIPEFGETRNTYSDTREIPGPDTGLLYTTETEVDAFVLNIAFFEGLYYVDSKGAKQNNTVTIGYRWRVSPNGVWQEENFVRTHVVGARTTTVRLGIRRQGLGHAIYDIEVRWIQVGWTDETRARWQPFLESVTEIQASIASYPYTALLGLRAVATDQLQGDLPNVTVEVQGRTVRAGGPEVWSDNPAWCTLDLLTNTRYGFGLADSEIDLSSFVAYAAYCDEMVDGARRHLLNYVLDREVRGQPLLLELMGGSRTVLVKSEGAWHARPTRNDAPVQLLTAANCTNVRLTYTRDPDSINVIEGRFANENLKFAQDVQTWPVLAEWPAEVHKASLELRGVTSPARVQRALQFELNRRRLENLSLEFEAAMDALVLQAHDVFRFSHPLPGWGDAGRVVERTTATHVRLDHPVTFQLGKGYHLYVRYHNGVTEVRDVWHPGTVTTDQLDLTLPLNWAGELPEQTLWAFGESTPAEKAVRLFRVVKMERTGEQTIRIQAMLHNGAIYDEPVAQPLPDGTTLWNPLGPAPPLVSLVAMELQRIQSSGAALTVVNLAWDVEPLGPGYAPYGGAQIFRRTVESNALAGVGTLGVVALGQSQSSVDGSGNFVPLARVSGQVMDLDDYTVVHGLSYVYRVVPISTRGVPNQVGSRDVLITVSGPTTDAFFPGTPQRLRLVGQAVGVTTFEGRDIAIEWDPVPPSPLFTTTYFVQEYLIEAWAPGQAFLLRRATTTARTWTYTYAMNQEDGLRTGQAGAVRTVLLLVYARTNTGRISLVPASLTVTNPPPDMSMIFPETIPLFEAGLIHWDQWVEPLDLDHYDVRLDTVTPPLAIYTAMPQIAQKVAAIGLQANVRYYTQIVPYDTFGIGLASAIADFTPAALSGGQTDTTPPSVPTGLTLSTGTEVNPDGTIVNWVQADWAASPEGDTKGYQVNWRVLPSTVPTVQQAGVVPQIRLHGVPGGVEIGCKVAAFDTFRNISAFTPEETIITGADSSPPAPIDVAFVNALGGLRSVMLSWVPPEDLDYLHTEVWASAFNDRSTANFMGAAERNFSYTGATPALPLYFWFRTVDTSGNMSAFVPDDFDGIVGTPVKAGAGDVLTTEAIITDAIQVGNATVTDAAIINLIADKITAGTLQVNVNLGLGAGAMYLNAVGRQIVVHDATGSPGVPRVIIGRTGLLNPTEYGMLIMNSAGQVMFNADSGGVTAQGITAGVVNAGHLRTDTAVITTAAQIQNALIDTAHIKDAAVSNAKIVSLDATKLTAGTITANVTTAGLFIVAGGGGQSLFALDGTNQYLVVLDTAGVWRVRLGHEGVGSANYGLWIWNAQGQLMWDFSTGATNKGIGDNTVDTPKVMAEAITEGVYWYESADTSGGPGQLLLGTITIGELAANDQVWVSGQAVVDMTGAIDGYLLLYADIDLVWSSRSTSQTVNTLVIQYVYTAPSPQTNLTFSLVGSTNGPSTYSMKSLVGLHRKR